MLIGLMQEESGQSIARITMLENEAWTKGWVDQKKNIKKF